MRHYVGYHNVEGMGCELEEELEDEKFGFYSNRPLSYLLKTDKQRIWMISGKKEGPKKTYRLHGYYTVKGIGKGSAGFEWLVHGKTKWFKPPVVINDCE